MRTPPLISRLARVALGLCFSGCHGDPVGAPLGEGGAISLLQAGGANSPSNPEIAVDTGARGATILVGGGTAVGGSSARSEGESAGGATAIEGGAGAIGGQSATAGFSGTGGTHTTEGRSAMGGTTMATGGIHAGGTFSGGGYVTVAQGGRSATGGAGGSSYSTGNAAGRSNTAYTTGGDRNVGGSSATSDTQVPALGGSTSSPTAAALWMAIINRKLLSSDKTADCDAGSACTDTPIRAQSRMAAAGNRGTCDAGP